MKHFIRTTACGAALIAAIGCGGRQSVASKSAAAYRNAIDKGVPVASGGHEVHEEHEAAHAQHEPAAMPGMPEMPAMPGAHDMARMPEMQHHGAMPAMPGMTHMDHGSMSGMQHMQHSSMPDMDMSNMPGMDHGARTSSSAVDERLARRPEQQSGGTPLRPDEFDAPAPSSVEEAKKAGHQ